VLPLLLAGGGGGGGCGGRRRDEEDGEERETCRPAEGRIHGPNTISLLLIKFILPLLVMRALKKNMPVTN
jgi:hypothetical protein